MTKLYLVVQMILLYKTNLYISIGAAEVNINRNLTTILNRNAISIVCYFDVRVLGVEMSSTIETGDFNSIAFYETGLPGKLTDEGKYLSGRVTLSNITQDSRNASITFDDLRCIDEREYKCKITFIDNSALQVKESEPMSITIQAKPSKPDRIEILGKLVFNGVHSTTVYPPSRPTMESEINEFYNTKNVPTVANNINGLVPITEGDNIIFSCSGNVGKPPASFLWEKFQSSGVMTTYNDINTDISYHAENCFFHRTSNITLQMFAEDNNATVRCVVVESDISDDKLYTETDPVKVLYKVRLPNITKQPNQDIYGKETKNIRLTCHSDGNPKPSYVWSKNGNILHNKSLMVISNVTVNDNGTYMCNVSNYVDNEHIMYSTSVSIVIVEEIVTTTKRTTTLSIADGTIEVRAQDNNTNTSVYIIVGVVLAVVFIAVVAVGIVYKYNQHRNRYRRKTNEGLHDYVNNAANLTSSNYDDLGVMRNESHYDELKHNKHLYTNVSPQ